MERLKPYDLAVDTPHIQTPWQVLAPLLVLELVSKDEVKHDYWDDLS